MVLNIRELHVLPQSSAIRSHSEKCNDRSFILWLFKITMTDQMIACPNSFFERRGLKETKMFLPHPRVKVSIVGSLCDREIACSASDPQASNFESCVRRTVSPQSSYHPQEVLLAQFSLYVHKGGIKPDSFHFFEKSTVNPNNLIHVPRCILYLYVTWQYAQFYFFFLTCMSKIRNTGISSLYLA